ncbi:MAG: hypothetical protein RI932_271, partial [Pseudomonadota bacterium]
MHGWLTFEQISLPFWIVPQSQRRVFE